MGLTFVTPLRDDAADACLEALLRDLSAFGCVARVDLARRLLECTVPFGNLAWAVHGGFAGVLRPYAACVTVEAPGPSQTRRAPRRRRGNAEERP